MPDIVICEPVRTPVGRYGGAFATLSAVDLASHTLHELVRRTGLGEGDVDDYAPGLRTGVRSGGIELMDRLLRARETAGGKYHPVPGGMLETAENLRRDYGISREEQDELAVRSQQRASAAHDAGRFDDELVPV